MLYQLSYSRAEAILAGAQGSARTGIYIGMESFGGDNRQNALWGRGGRTHRLRQG